MWKNFSFNSPRITFGMDSVAQLGEEAKKMAAKRVLVVTGPSVKKTGVWDKAKAALKAQKLDYDLYVQPRTLLEPSATEPEEMAQAMEKGKFDLIVGIGGGSVMDTAKMAAALVTNKGKTGDYYGLDNIPKRGLPAIMLPTTSGTSSEMTPFAVFINPDTHQKSTVVSFKLLPDLAIIDPMLTVSAPASITAATGMDAFIHALEAYLSKAASPVCDTMAIEAMAGIARWIGPAYADGGNLEARYEMSLATMYAGFCLCNVGAHLIHAMGQTFSAEEDVSHGNSLCAVLVACVEALALAQPEKVFNLGELLGEDMEGYSLREGAEVALDALASLMRSIKMPTCLPDLDIDPDENKLKEWAKVTYDSRRQLAKSPRDFTFEDVLDIYYSAMQPR